MTNKPMLSVERETIKAILGRSGNGYMAAWNELRAMFDNPTQDEPLIAAELVALLRADLRQQVEAYRAEVSGNYRGQPVAIFEIDTSGYRARIILDPEQPFPQTGTKLYAEQPAPVAVVMPGRKTKADYSGYIEQFQSEAAGLYNSALDDVSRLNGVKP